jgi:PAS domain S-box-containing protein
MRTSCCRIKDRQVSDVTSERASGRGAVDKDSQRPAEAIDRLSPSVLVVLLKFDGTIKYANRPALEVIAASPDAVLGRPFVEAPWWSACERTRRRLETAIAAGAAGAHSRFDVVISTAAGQALTCDFSLDPVFDDHPTEGYLVASAYDVTERRRAEGSLWATQVAADRAPAPLFQVTPGGKIRYVNDAGCRFLGYSREQVLERTVHEITSELAPAAWPNWWNRLKAHRTLRKQCLARHRDGRSIPVGAVANYIEHESTECA